jgi:hypothetical protein
MSVAPDVVTKVSNSCKTRYDYHTYIMRLESTEPSPVTKNCSRIIPEKFLNSNLFKKFSALFGSLRLICYCTRANRPPILSISSHMVAGNTVLRDGNKKLVVQSSGRANQFFSSPESPERFCVSCSVGVGGQFSEGKPAGA